VVSTFQYILLVPTSLPRSLASCSAILLLSSKAVCNLPHRCIPIPSRTVHYNMKLLNIPFIQQWHTYIIYFKILFCHCNLMSWIVSVTTIIYHLLILYSCIASLKTAACATETCSMLMYIKIFHYCSFCWYYYYNIHKHS
jgi:hypothetical protein